METCETCAQMSVCGRNVLPWVEAAVRGLSGPAAHLAPCERLCVFLVLCLP